MSMSNFGRNPSMTQHETNNQKTLIYDLRSELSNLKNQFSRLITKPADLSGKSKIQVKPVIKSRYSAVSLEQQNCSQPNSTSQSNNIIRAPQGTKLEFHKTESAHFYKNTYGGLDKISTVSKKSPTSKDCFNHEATFSKNDPIAKTVEVKNQECREHLTPSKIKKQSETIVYYRKSSNNADEISDKSSTMSSKVTDKSTQYLTSKSYKIYNNDDANINNQKIKKLQAQCQANSSKIAALNQQVGELTQKLSQSQKDCQDLQIKNTKKQQKIWKLEQNMRQMTQKVGKANEQTMEMGKQKNKQIDLIKQGHMSQLKNQQKDFQNRLTVQRKNNQVKYQSMIKSIRQSYQAKLLEVGRQKQRLVQQLNSQSETVDKLNTNINDLKQQKSKFQLAISNSKAEVNKSNETIEHLKSKQIKLQNQLKQEKAKYNKAQCKQVGINCEEKSQVPAVAPSAGNNSTTQTSLEQQNKILQDKLANYLNNIDKQSMKLKEQKGQLDRSQKVVEECNRVICEKDILIRNLMKDCKNMEKELIQNRRVKRELELLLEDANIAATIMQMEKLNSKYKGA